MAVLKCKMCGGNLNIAEGETVAVCEYCDTKQTVPTVDNEKKLTLFSRANRLRAACEFDKAAGVYENIVADFPEEAEAYWGLVLCKFGIEYVDDPATGKKIPTCHRSSFDSIMDDTDFEQVMENADSVARKVYREEAKAIEELRKGIIEVSSREEPYDIFICYKETDENGDRTIDSVIAQDIYDRLIEKQYRVFFARISLEDKLGTAYEPYIFAALNSARIMLAIGTDYDYYNAVWVKNEWSRFLTLMAKDKKKMLIPCYKNLDAYDIPKEFKHLQGQDMGKVGAMQDLLRGIEKILPKNKSASFSSKVIENYEKTEKAGISSLLKRVYLFLDDGDWDSADRYCEKILDIDPENGEAYLGKLLVEYRSHSIEELSNGMELFGNSKNYQKIIRFGDDRIKNEATNALESVSKNKELYLYEKEKKRQDLLSDLKIELDAIGLQISTMQKNLYNSPEKGQIFILEKENQKLFEEKEKLIGLKNKNEKKALQNTIDDNNNKIKLLEEQHKQNTDSIRMQLPELMRRKEKIEAEIQRINNSSE